MHKKRFTETNWRRSTRQQPGTKIASRPADKPRINRSLTADFVPSFGLHKISLVRASGETFKQCVLDVWEGTREPCFLDRIFCRRPCPALPRHALHEKSLQRHKGVGPLVSSQKQRALIVPLMNRRLIAGQPRVLFLRRFTYDFACSCFRGNVQDTCLRCPGGHEERLCESAPLQVDEAWASVVLYT